MGTVKKRVLNIVVCITLLFFLCSCSTVLKTTKVDSLTTNYCAPKISYQYQRANEQDSPYPKQDSILRSHLSTHDILLSEDINVAPQLAAYFATKDTLKMLVLRQKITDRIILANTELDAVAAELDCNGERIDQLARYVDNINTKSNRRLTVGSVVVGALTTVATVAISKKGLNTTVGVAGGLVSAGLGALTINPKGKKVNMTLDRNLLRNVWNNNNDDNAFPPSVWKILGEKSFSNNGDSSLRETIKSRWLRFTFDGKAKPEDVDLYFDKGGLFTSDNLHTLANMYNELQASVRSVQQDMQSLNLAISKF